MERGSNGSLGEAERRSVIDQQSARAGVQTAGREGILSRLDLSTGAQSLHALVYSRNMFSPGFFYLTGTKSSGFGPGWSYELGLNPPGGQWRSQLELMSPRVPRMAPKGVMCLGTGTDCPISPSSISHRDGSRGRITRSPIVEAAIGRSSRCEWRRSWGERRRGARRWRTGGMSAAGPGSCAGRSTMNTEVPGGSKSSKDTEISSPSGLR